MGNWLEIATGGSIGIVTVLIGIIFNGFDNRIKKLEASIYTVEKGQEEMRTNYTDKFKEVIQNQNDVRSELVDQQNKVHLEMVNQQNIVKTELLKSSSLDKEEILAKISDLNKAIALVGASINTQSKICNLIQEQKLKSKI